MRSTISASTSAKVIGRTAGSSPTVKIEGKFNQCFGEPVWHEEQRGGPR